jgi:hypothetical protein
MTSVTEGSSEMTNIETLGAERVARGVALLDQAAPGWANKIDLGFLNLEDACNCVLGQVYNTGRAYPTGFDIGLEQLHAEGLGWYYGFDISEDQSDPVTYAVLDQEWVRIIKERQS